MRVKVAAGSDMRYAGAEGLRVSDEVAELVRAGLPPMGAIQAATSTAAACLGIDGRTGAIRAGLEADLIVIEGDPLEDVGRLREVVLVVNDGRIVVDRIGE